MVLDASITVYVAGLAMAEIYNFIVWLNRASTLVGENVLGLYTKGIKECINYFRNFGD